MAVGLALSAAAGSAFADTPYADLIARHAAANGVPVQLAEAVVRHESNFNPRVTGRAGEIGLMQIKLQTARGLGYHGTRNGLYDPATNIAWGMKYLGAAARLAGGSECGTLSRYNAGLFTRRMVPGYCRQVAAKSYAAAHVQVGEVRVASADHAAHRRAGAGDVLAYAGGSRVEATRNIFDDLFASN